MKKKITLLFVLVSTLFTSLCAQGYLFIDGFEDQTSKFSPNAGNIQSNVVVNPKKSGLNTSNYVLKVEGNSSAQNWEGIMSVPFSITIGNTTVVNPGEYRYVHVKMLRSQEAKILAILKNSEEDNTESFPLETWVGESDDWQYVVVDLLDHSPWSVGGDMDNKTFTGGMILSLNRNGGAQTVYVDDILFSPTTNPITSPTNITKIVPDNTDIRLSRSLDNGVVAHIGKLEGKLKMEVYNLQGSLLKVIYDGTAIQGSYDIPSFGQGIYLLKVVTNEKTYTLKF